MSDLKLFRVDGGTATEVPGRAMGLEKPLQALLEKNMDVLFGVRFLASEYSTGKKHGGRIDSLGIDENSSPVIFEYKRDTNQNVINQGLFYLDWLLDHRAEFEKLALDRAGVLAVEWGRPRLVCVANGFTRYDEHAVQQIDRSIELVRYRDYGGELLALELLTSSEARSTAAGRATPGPAERDGAVLDDRSGAAPVPAPVRPRGQKTVAALHEQSPQDLKDLYESLEEHLLSVGDDVVKKVTANYYAFRRLKNFACVEVHPQSRNLLVYVKADLASITPEPGFSRDVAVIGHFGTGNLELVIDSSEDLERAKPWILASYEAN